MIRALLLWLTGRPRCDYGTAFGGGGCWRAAAWQTKPPIPERWERPLRFCELHSWPNRDLWYVPVPPPSSKDSTP